MNRYTPWQYSHIYTEPCTPSIAVDNIQRVSTIAVHTESGWTNRLGFLAAMCCRGGLFVISVDVTRPASVLLAGARHKMRAAAGTV